MLATKEKSHPGFQLPTAALHPGLGFAISNTATEFHTSVYDFRGGPRSSGYFRDQETGLDYAQNRYHQPGMGRFLSPDPFMGSAGPSSPGSWNRYAYVMGDPVNRVDRKGLDGGMVIGCDPNDPDPSDCAAYSDSGDGSSGGEDDDEEEENDGQSTQSQAPPAAPPCQTGLGAGLTASADAGAGIGVVGAAAMGSVAAGVSGSSSGASAGGSASGGAFANAGNSVVGVPNQNQVKPLFIAGAAAGAGVGGYITNAGSNSQLSGPFATFGVDLGFFVNISLTLSVGTNNSGSTVWQLSGTGGYGFGALVYVGTTTTAASGQTCGSGSQPTNGSQTPASNP
jgi:RHS repeat-associated protein